MRTPAADLNYNMEVAFPREHVHGKEIWSLLQPSEKKISNFDFVMWWLIRVRPSVQNNRCTTTRICEIIPLLSKWWRKQDGERGSGVEREKTMNATILLLLPSRKACCLSAPLSTGLRTPDRSSHRLRRLISSRLMWEGNEDEVVVAEIFTTRLSRRQLKCAPRLSALFKRRPSPTSPPYPKPQPQTPLLAHFPFAKQEILSRACHGGPRRSRWNICGAEEKRFAERGVR